MYILGNGDVWEEGWGGNVWEVISDAWSDMESRCADEERWEVDIDEDGGRGSCSYVKCGENGESIESCKCKLYDVLDYARGGGRGGTGSGYSGEDEIWEACWS